MIYAKYNTAPANGGEAINCSVFKNGGGAVLGLNAADSYSNTSASCICASLERPGTEDQRDAVGSGDRVETRDKSLSSSSRGRLRRAQGGTARRDGSVGVRPFVSVTAECGGWGAFCLVHPPSSLRGWVGPGAVLTGRAVGSAVSGSAVFTVQHSAVHHGTALYPRSPLRPPCLLSPGWCTRFGMRDCIRVALYCARETDPRCLRLPQSIQPRQHLHYTPATLHAPAVSRMKYCYVYIIISTGPTGAVFHAGCISLITVIGFSFHWISIGYSEATHI